MLHAPRTGGLLRCGILAAGAISSDAGQFRAGGPDRLKKGCESQRRPYKRRRKRVVRKSREDGFDAPA